MIATLRSRPPGASTSPHPSLPRRGPGPIDSLRQAVPDGLEEIQTLAKTLIERASDILAYFDRPSYL